MFDAFFSKTPRFRPFSVFNGMPTLAYKVRPLRSRPIMLLAHDRSGSTWVGHTLGMARDAIYLHEPINPSASLIGNGWLYNVYIEKDAEASEHRRIFDKACQGYGVRKLSNKEISVRLFGRPHVIIKETGGMMNGEWFARTYKARILVLARHPAPLILSNIRLNPRNADNWLGRILSQQKIREEHLEGVAANLDDYTKADVVTKFAVIYAIRYRVALNQLARNPDWLLVKYETLCEAPVTRFEALYQQLGLDFTDEIGFSIERDCSTDGSNAFFGTRRISRSNLTKWFAQCGEEDRARIRRVLETFQLPLYNAEADWTTPAAN